MAESPDHLRVFLSSRMAVLIDLRATLRQALKAQGLDLFVYETDAGARPQSPEQTSLEELERSDIVVFVLEHSYGEVTEREYDHARTLEKPCLVYVRLREAADERQGRFLAKVKGPRGVPSRETFLDAVDLSDKVARDVQHWLVREYRRLSAAVADRSTPPRQSTQFAVGMERLQTATSVGLQPGGPADLLSWQIRLWFNALGYPLDGEASPDGAYVEFLVRIPERRRFRTVLVRAKDAEVLAPDVADARRALDARRSQDRVDECWVVSPQRVSPAARNAIGPDGAIVVFTFDELIEEDVDFSHYFAWLDGEAAREKLDESYVPLAASVNEVGADGTPAGTSRYEDVGSYVDQWLRDPSGEHISLLGEFGTGKSWFALMYATKLARQYRDAQRDHTPRPRVPLLVRLRDYARGFKDVAALLTDFVFREHEINIPTYTALQTLNRLGRVLFIFDGFDEMAARVDRQKMADNFWAMAAVLGPGSKAILTCRTEYFQFAQQARDVLGGKLRGSRMRDTTDVSRFQVAELAMFDRPRLERVLAKRANPSQVKAVLANENLVDLAKRPVMVDLLIEAMPFLDAASANLARVYYLAVTRKMQRDIGEQRTFTSLADKMFFMCELSAEMLFTDQMTLHFKAFPERIRQYFGSGTQDVAEDHWHHDLLSQTMLVRDDDGHYKPAHRSLLEFFAAYKLAAEIGALSEDYLAVLQSLPDRNANLRASDYQWSTFFNGTLVSRRQSAPLGRFVREGEERMAAGWGRLKSDRTFAELIYLLCGEPALRATLATSGEAPATSAHYVARLIQILHTQGETRGLELNDAIVQRLQMSDADLTEARLAGTHWSDCTITRVRLDRSVLAGARLDNVRFVDVTLRGADVTSTTWDERSTMSATIRGAAWGRGPNGDILILSSADGRFLAVDPLASRAVAIDLALHVDWQHQVEGIVECPPVGPVDFAGRPPDVMGIRAQAWRTPLLRAGVELHYETSILATDVDAENILVRTGDSGRAPLAARFIDASSRGATEDSFMTVSPSGLMLAGVRGPLSGPKQVVVIRKEGELTLAGAQGHYQAPGSFSPDESLIAVGEFANQVGVWRTDTGELVARVLMPVSLEGAQVEGATGLAAGILSFAVPHPDGWTLDEPV